jgi:hypothetical protein
MLAALEQAELDAKQDAAEAASLIAQGLVTVEDEPVDEVGDAAAGAIAEDAGGRRRLSQLRPFSGVCGCWRCPSGTRTGRGVRRVVNAVCLPGRSVADRVPQATVLAVTAPGPCSEEGIATVDASVRSFLAARIASVVEIQVTCREDLGRVAALGAADVAVAAVGVSANVVDGWVKIVLLFKAG